LQAIVSGWARSKISFAHSITTISSPPTLVMSSSSRGPLLDLDRVSKRIDELGERIFRLMLETASGRHTKSELHGYGQNEFVPWQLGAVM